MFFFGFENPKQQQQQNEENEEDLVPTKVETIDFDGLNRTQQDIILELVKPILKSKNLNETLRNVNFVRERFYELGLFKNVQVSVDTIDKGGDDEQKSSDEPLGLSVEFNVDETKRYAGGMFISGNHNDVSANLELRSPNLFGRGEELRCQFEQTMRYYGSWSATFSKPLIKTPWRSLRSNFDLTLMQLSKYCPWSGYRDLNRNFVFGLNIQPNPYNYHTIQWQTSWRYLSGLGNEQDFEIVEQFGHSLKSSISHTYTYDLRDSSVLPTKGSMFKFFNEYAGFQKYGASFRKHEIEFQHNLSSFLQLSLKGGTMKNYNNITVSDKFFIGGPLNLRGFKMYGVGEHGEQNISALGALKYWLAALHLQIPLPFKNNFEQNLRLHSFLNAGSISNKFEELKENIRLSIGAGLIFTFGKNIRFEANYCWPLYNQKSDKLNQGFQFGVGMTYV